MRIPGRKTAVQGKRWLRSRLGERCVILGYHSISNDSWDPFDLRVSAPNFRQHLEVLRTIARPVALSSLWESLHERRIPRAAVALTFDDGYADWLHEVRPTLLRYEMPATFFLVSGYLGKALWWDALADVFHPENRLPERVAMTLPGGTRLAFGPGAKPAERRRALLGLHNVFWALDLEIRNEVLRALTEELSAGVRGPGPPRCLIPTEVRDLAVPDLLEIGAHGHTHRPLHSLAREEQREELRRARAILGDLTEEPPTAFSFPHGSVPEGSDALLAACGYRTACTSTPDVVRRKSERLALPRLWVPNVNGRTFSRWIRRWL